MKCLTIVVDDKEIFAGEVAEIQWTETAETVSVTGKFNRSPSLLESLQQASKQPKRQLSHAATLPTNDTDPMFPDE